jgi:hypothetical protein
MTYLILRQELPPSIKYIGQKKRTVHDIERENQITNEHLDEHILEGKYFIVV